MRLAYGRGYEERYEEVSREIPDGAEVLDVCCGDCRIYQKYLRPKKVHYRGMDSSPGFERQARKLKIPLIVSDLRRKDIPQADYILMMASLYQFFDGADELLSTLLHRAGRKLIVTEPIVNLAVSPFPLVRALARSVTGSSERFDEASFQALISPYRDRIARVKKIARGREILVVFNGAGAG